jgi:hypothetical protein
LEGRKGCSDRRSVRGNEGAIGWNSGAGSARSESRNSAHFPKSGSEVEVWNNRDTSGGGYQRNDQGERATTAKGHPAIRAATTVSTRESPTERMISSMAQAGLASELSATRKLPATRPRSNRGEPSRHLDDYRDDEGDWLRRVTRRFQDLQPDPPEFENLVVAQRSECEGCVCRSAPSVSCAHTIAQLQMFGNKISVEMRQEYIFFFRTRARWQKQRIGQCPAAGQ